MLQAHGLAPLELGPKEVSYHFKINFVSFNGTKSHLYFSNIIFCIFNIQGIALINGTQLITSLGVEGKHDSLYLFSLYH